MEAEALHRHWKHAIVNVSPALPSIRTKLQTGSNSRFRRVAFRKDGQSIVYVPKDVGFFCGATQKVFGSANRRAKIFAASPH